MTQGVVDLPQVDCENAKASEYAKASKSSDDKSALRKSKGVVGHSSNLIMNMYNVYK